MQSRSLDLTSGAPLPLLVRFAVPMLIGAVFQLLYNMVDSIVLGRFVSAAAFASVGATSSTVAFIVLIGNALMNGMSILASQAFGAKDEAALSRTAAQSMAISLAAGALIGVLSFLGAPALMRMLGAPADIIDGSVTYVRITCGLYLAQILYNAPAGILRSIGDSRTPLLFLVLCCLLNIVLDLLFAVVLSGGVAGVAWATILAQSVSAALCLIYTWRRYPMLRFSLSDMAPDPAFLKPFFSITVPLIFQNTMLTVGMMVITRVINGFGSDIVAAFTLGSKVEQLVTVLFSQFAFSFAVYAGQNKGAGRLDRIGLGLRDAAKLLSVLVAFSMVIMFFFGDRLALLFINREETAILTAGVSMIRIEACFLPALCAIWLVNSCLRGLSCIRPTVVSSMVELASKVLLSILLSAVLGYTGIWLAAPIGWCLGLIPGLVFYLRGSWRTQGA